MFSAIDTITKSAENRGLKNAEIIKKGRTFYGFRNKENDKSRLPV